MAEFFISPKEAALLIQLPGYSHSNFSGTLILIKYFEKYEVQMEKKTSNAVILLMTRSKVFFQTLLLNYLQHHHIGQNFLLSE